MSEFDTIHSKQGRQSGKYGWMHGWTRGLLFPLVLGLLFAVGNAASQQGRLPVLAPRFWLTALFFVALFTIAFACAYNFLDIHSVLYVSSCNADAGRRQWWRFEHRLAAPAVFRDVLRLLVCWSPMAFMMYPGLRGMDAGEMIAQYFGYATLHKPAGTIWLHHPWLDTLFHGSIVKTSMRLTGSPDLGEFAICLLQAAVAATGFMLAFAWFASKGVGRRALAVSTLFIAFFPIVPFVVFNINKDMTYASFLVLYCALVFMVLDDDHRRLLRNPGFDLFFLLLSLIVSQTAKSGFLVVVMLGVLLMVVAGPWRRRLLALMSVVVVVLFADVVAPRVIYPRIHAIKGNTSAALVVPIQMMARVAHLHPHELTAVQEKAFRSYFNYSWQEMGRRYTPFIVDPVLSTCGEEARPGRPSKQFVELWKQEGARHPAEYAESYLLLQSGWYSFAAVGSRPEVPFMMGVRENIFNPNLIVEADAFSQHHGPVEKTWRSRMFQDIYLAVASVPGLNLLSMLCLYQSILPFFGLYVLWRRRHRLGGRGFWQGFAGLSLWLLVAGSMWFAAVTQSIVSSSASRYVYPTLFLTPLAILFLVYLMGRPAASRAD